MKRNWSDPKLYNQSLPTSIDYLNVPIGALIKGSAKQYGDRNAYIYRDQGITYKYLYEMSLKFANGLRKLGVGKGDAVSTHLPTCPQYIIAYFGILLTGAKYSPLNPLLVKNDLIFQLNNSETSVVITDENGIKEINKVFDETQLEHVIITGEQEKFTFDNPIDLSNYKNGGNYHSFAALTSYGSSEEIDVSIDPKEDIAHIAYTGGTTGQPKGVMITHANVIANISQIAFWSYGSIPKILSDGSLIVEPFEKNKDKHFDKYNNYPGEGSSISPSPLFHGAGVIGQILSPVLMGSTTILFDQFNPSEFLALIDKYQVDNVSGAPAMWNYLLHHPDMKKYDFSFVTGVSSGAAPLAIDEMKALENAFPNAGISEGYGLSEATASVTNTVSFKGGAQKLGTVGLPTYDTEIRIVSLDGLSDDPLPLGEIGEISIRGPQIMKGYYNNEEETNIALRDGWLLTGDIGKLDEDGFLSVVDRKTDMLIYNGYNVYPRKLEELLYSNPMVASAAVIGVPEEKVGEIPKAFIVLRQPGAISKEELMDFVNEQVIHYEKIRELEFVEQLPMTAAGKISKQELKEVRIEK